MFDHNVDTCTTDHLCAQTCGFADVGWSSAPCRICGTRAASVSASHSGAAPCGACMRTSCCSCSVCSGTSSASYAWPSSAGPAPGWLQKTLDRACTESCDSCAVSCETSAGLSFGSWCCKWRTYADSHTDWIPCSSAPSRASPAFPVRQTFRCTTCTCKMGCAAVGNWMVCTFLHVAKWPETYHCH